MNSPPGNLEDLKDLLLMFWCNISEDTFRDLVQPMPCWVRDILEGTYKMLGIVATVADQCIFVWTTIIGTQTVDIEPSRQHS